MKLTWMFGFLMAMCLMPLMAFADLPVVPDGDPLAALLALIANWKSSAPLALGMGVVALLTQVFKKFFPAFPYTRVVVTVLACAYGVLAGVVQGLPLLSVVVTVLISGGGAVAIYEAAKGVSAVVVPPASPSDPVV